MADFKEVLKKANDGYHDRKDYPPYALSSWDERIRWSNYLEKINNELEKDKCPDCDKEIEIVDLGIEGEYYTCPCGYERAVNPVIEKGEKHE